jgi:hypothetical protein
MTVEFHRDSRAETHARRRAAIHEAGHIIAGRHVGNTRSHGYIEPAKLVAREFGIITWQGGSFARNENMAWRDQRLIGVAGSVAEYCWGFRSGPSPDLDEIYEGMSPTDRETHSWNSGRRLDLNTSTEREERAWDNAITRAYRLFNCHTGPLWPALLNMARHLIVESRNYEDRYEIPFADVEPADPIVELMEARHG